MKIAHINTTRGRSGTEGVVFTIHNMLVERGDTSIVTYGRGPVLINNDENHRIGTDVDVLGHLVQTRILDNHGFASRHATIKFLIWLESNNPDVVHLHNIHGYYINCELLFEYLKVRRINVVWTLHDCWPITGHCTNFEYINCEKWKYDCGRCGQLAAYPKTLFVDRTKKNLLRKRRVFSGVERLSIVTPSKWLSEIIHRSYLDQYPVSVINNALDLEVFRNKNGNFKARHCIEKKFMILGVAYVWGGGNGFDYFLRLSADLPSEYVIVLVGLTKRQVSFLPAGIIGIERTANVEELVEIYSEANVFCNPTLDDNFPTVNIEALACGTPIITFRTGGSPEAVGEDCGIIVEKGDYNGLIGAISEIRHNQSVYSPENCRRHAEKYFDKRTRYLDYLQLYNSLI